MSVKKYGEYALVTGASSGIGKEFAIELAKEGFNLVLVARRKKELNDLAQELQEKQGVKVLPYNVDLTLPNAVEQLDAFTQTMDIGLVILNAGIRVFTCYFSVSLLALFEKAFDFLLGV